MSISIHGNLRIKRINGSNGPFCVGDLETEIGEFRVKDAVLDQFDEGLYTGQFWIQQIYPWSYSSYGRMVIEIRAKLADLQIDGRQRGANSRDMQEPDPAKETPTSPAAPTPSESQPSSAPAPQPDAEPDETGSAAADTADLADDPDWALFGDEIYALVLAREAVKLDPTIDRIQFRLQRDRLKALGYSFHAGSQSWQLAGS
jgi:hypothetical protein